MLEKVPEAIGRALSDVRAGLDQTLYEAMSALPATLILTSPAFEAAGALPAASTVDGPGTSPPLAWSGVPAGARELVLFVEDADSPTPHPIVHAIAHGLAAADGALDEGALSGRERAAATGRNAYLKTGWLPPDPPTGHGAHRYCFQLFALGAPAGLPNRPGRKALAAAVKQHAIARGRLIGTYRRV